MKLIIRSRPLTIKPIYVEDCHKTVVNMVRVSIDLDKEYFDKLLESAFMRNSPVLVEFVTEVLASVKETYNG